jgi:hypothetical protein
MKMKNRPNALTDPQQIAALASAIAACEKGPLVPACFNKFIDGGNARDLPVEVQYIKSNLPRFLLKSSAADLSELTARLKKCAEFAKKTDQLGIAVASALKLICEFEQEVLDLAAHVQDMAYEADC